MAITQDELKNKLRESVYAGLSGTVPGIRFDPNLNSILDQLADTLMSPGTETGALESALSKFFPAKYIARAQSDIRGHLPPNLNDLRNELTTAGKKQEQIEQDIPSILKQIELSSSEDVAKYIGGLDLKGIKEVFPNVTPDQLNIIGAGTAKQLERKISTKIGRTPSQEEIGLVFNNLPFSTGITTNNSWTGFLQNPSDWVKGLVSDRASFSPSGLINSLKENFDTISSAELELKQYETTLSPEQRNQILSASTPEAGKTLAAQIIKNVASGKITEEIPKATEAELRAIGEAEQQATERTQRLFSEQFVPQTEQILERRGLRTSGSFAEALAGGAVNLRRELQQQFEPLRLQAKTGGISRSFEQVLRQGLEQGQTFQQALINAQNMLFLGRQQSFAASESALDRKLKELLGNQYLAAALASQPRTYRPSGFEQFLQYGLGPLTTITTPFIEKGLEKGFKNIFK